MTVRKADALFILFAVAVVVGVSMLPTPKDRNPPVPTNATHLEIRAEQACVSCHAPAGSKPLPDRHPKRQDCFRCHARGA